MSIKTKAFVLKFLAFSFWSISFGGREGAIFSDIWKAWLQSVLVSLPLRAAFLFLFPSLLLHSIHSLNTDAKTKQGVYLLAKEKWLMGVGWKNKWKCSVTQMKCLKGGERETDLVESAAGAVSLEAKAKLCWILSCSVGAVFPSLACQGCLTTACSPMKKHREEEEKFPWLG